MVAPQPFLQTHVNQAVIGHRQRKVYRPAVRPTLGHRLEVIVPPSIRLVVRVCSQKGALHECRVTSRAGGKGESGQLDIVSVDSRNGRQRHET